jgi:glycosyltransferase involved in cell wall biosynthesis
LHSLERGVFVAGVVDKDYWAARMKEPAPKVSIIMPCLNEERFIGRAIESLVDDYFREHCELIVADGMSDDGTKEIVRSLIDREEAEIHGIKREGQIRLLDNAKRIQSHGLNLGIKEARGEIIVRADAHCVFPAGYVKSCVELLETKRAANVGGTRICVASKEGFVAQAIALAVSHPVGVGDARFQLGNYRGFTEAAYYGTFRRELFEEIGLYDPQARTNEDGELNIRIQKAGKRIYLDSSIKVLYFPRETMGRLARQYFCYGKGRCYTFLKHKRLTSWRQAAPVALVMGLGGALILSIWIPAFLIIPAAYALALLGAALASRFPGIRSRVIGMEDESKNINDSSRSVPVRLRLLMALAWAVMHISWGAGFLARIILGKKTA